MKTQKQYRDDFNRQVEADRNFRGFLARMGRADGTIDAGDGNVYVVMLDGQTFSIPNRRLPLGIKPVFLGTTQEDRDTLQVLSTWEVYDKPWPAGVVPHGPQHGLTGFDPDWIEIERFRWMLVLPKPSLGDFYIQLYGGDITINGATVTVNNQTFNLASYVPATGALYALIQVNASGIINVKLGTPVASRQLLTNADIPEGDADNFVDCAIALYDSQKKIQRDIRVGHVNDFVDKRLAQVQNLSIYALKTNVLELDNTDPFTPDADYEPATKKYVDDNAGGGGDASSVTYTPNNPADWDGCIEPDFVDEALDQLAERVTDLEGGGGGDGLVWEIITANQTAEVNHGYIANKGTLLTLLLPATAAVGDIVRISGMGAGGWTITQNADGIIHFGNLDSTVGVGGSLASVHRRDAVELICCVTNNEWSVLSSAGNITVT